MRWLVAGLVAFGIPGGVICLLSLSDALRALAAEYAPRCVLLDVERLLGTERSAPDIWRRRLFRHSLMGAADNRPMDVLLVIGGNDLCQRDLDVHQLSPDLIALGQGLRAAEAVEDHLELVNNAERIPKSL
ncbi:hypothetical protein FJT64_000779 [Amphibalanus amphitrite]|uniref:Uncharacterized protein n=1 Tax=Amphibalanus amphitrite TaxID=1232801 RepID=A0A6A4VTF2_AMPAM|nr:hypothetical protein FJT64_000779 [Amphibalanus amphitrite]